MKKRTWLIAVLTIVMTAAMIGPVSAAITRFTDVPDSNIFAEDIAWMDENAMTTGCGTDIFCPSDNVTREQMSAFMHRLATKQVVDAATVGGLASSAFAPKVHDHDASYLAITGTAADSTLLEGRGASDLMRVASFTFNDDRAPDDFARLAFFDIEAPTAGFLMLSSSLEAITTLSTELIYCAFALDGTIVDGSATLVSIDSVTPNAWIDCGAQAVVPVTAGTHTITIMGFYDSLLNTYFSWGTASALFLPFDGAGEQPTDFTIDEPESSQTPFGEARDD